MGEENADEVDITLVKNRHMPTRKNRCIDKCCIIIGSFPPPRIDLEVVNAADGLFLNLCRLRSACVEIIARPLLVCITVCTVGGCMHAGTTPTPTIRSVVLLLLACLIELLYC